MNERKIETLKQTELFRDLNADILQVLADHAIEKRLERDEILFIAGEDAKGVYVIASGSVRAFRTGADGREQVIHLERAVTTIAEVPVFDNGNYPSTVAAEEPTLVYFIDKKEVFSLSLRHPQIALSAAGLLAKRLRRCAELVESLSLREVGQRVAALLLEEAQARGTPTADGIRFRQKHTHNQLAARAGTVREVITRVLNRLQAQGFIAIEGKDVIILDFDSLTNYAELEKS